jgi:hypothetical protein
LGNSVLPMGRNTFDLCNKRVKAPYRLSTLLQLKYIAVGLSSDSLLAFWTNSASESTLPALYDLFSYVV